MSISAVAVFCGSKSGNNPLYEKHAAQIGVILASKKIRLIYGGENKGLMWKLAEAALLSKGEVVGIIPKLLLDDDKPNQLLTEFRVVDNLHERKQLFYQSCDAALVLPGGFGTLDEMFELLTWNQLKIQDKPIFILNSDGYYQHLIQHFQKMEADGFLYGTSLARVSILSAPEEIIPWL